ncbi:abortive infection system toxin AbiGii family protein [Listeria seeligeri]|uniref:abortive infection system toxin AbiGii family protein n=1 Tax=Listeria seeligeri TaxID=1640 RepID=UPI00162A314C|nr:abortive infection system toxin AbiGii family protein [Listeria seeligeri]MBC1990332.1 hypothetical protein [Listeria seeligeri]
MRFKKGFEDKENNQIVAADAFIKFLDGEVPSNMHYISKNNKEFYLVPKDKKENHNFKLIINKKELFGDMEIDTVEEFAKLLYRTQKTITGRAEDMKHFIGDISIEHEKMVKLFGKDVEFKKGNYYITPEPFPPPFEVEYKFGGNKFPLKLERKPYQSLTEVLLESVDEDIFHFRIKLFNTDDESLRMNIKISYNFNNAASLDSIIEQKEKIISFSSGHLELLGNSIKLNDGAKDENVLKLFDFYEKLKAISTKLDREFDVSEIIKLSDFINMNKLYYSFVKNKYYYLNEPVKKFSMFFYLENEDFVPEDMLNKPITCIGSGKIEVNLLNQKFLLKEQFVFKNAIYLPEASSDTQDNEFVFEPSDDKHRYQKLFERDTPNELMDLIGLKEAAEIKLDERNLNE